MTEFIRGAPLRRASAASRKRTPSAAGPFEAPYKPEQGTSTGNRKTDVVDLHRTNTATEIQEPAVAFRKELRPRPAPGDERLLALDPAPSG